ncbi:MAG: hypothetical protein FJ291_11315 [Planctomycetes bacterium]|nr:hypothetical protein [Planctomycetota bacterium]
MFAMALLAGLAAWAGEGEGAARPLVSVVAGRALGPGATHGLGKLLGALAESGVAAERAHALNSARGTTLVVAGVASEGGPAATLLKANGVAAPAGAEALAIRRIALNGKPTLLVAGSDDRGLMYALLDVADRVAWAADPAEPLSEVKDCAEKPAVPERALSMFTFHRARFESFFHDEAFWARYLDTLARNRFNSFVLIFGYENWGYFAPPYPYFFDLEEFPDVRVVGITAEQQRRNLEALNRVIRMTHDRGLSFTLGIWDHIYRGGVQGPTDQAHKPTEGLVWGLTAEKLVPFTKAALARFLKLVPTIDALQFRMHGESGLKREEMDAFWANVYQVMKDSGGKIRFDARAKEFPDALIDKALAMGVPIRICTKYWAEQMGLPFHPTHVNPQNQRDRRHGYADLLRYPKRYAMHWRLWNGGTARVLLWGDPDYVRRFAESTHLYDGQGFEVNEPLCTKMQDQPHGRKPFGLLNPQWRYYDYEFERYWHFFQVFGRVGYNPDTPPEVWRNEFARRFGKAAAPFVERALHRASWVLPRIVASCFPYHRFPMTRGWAEKQRREDLPAYAKAEASDTEQFLTIDEAARLHLEGKDSARLWPQANSAWYAALASDVLEAVTQAERAAGAAPSKEFAATMVDLRILANLALYHSRRIHAGLGWAYFEHAKDLNALDDAVRHEAEAIEAWEKLVEAAGDVYHPDLMFGRPSAGLSGHWRDELAELKKGLAKLQQQRDSFRPAIPADAPAIAHVPTRKAPPGNDLAIRATVSGPKPIAAVRLGLRTAQGQAAYTDMEPAGPFRYRGAIPAARVAEGLTYFIEATDEAGRKASTQPILVTVTNDTEPPGLTHVPPATVPAEKPLAITAEVRDPSGVKWVRLRYRSVTQFDDYRTLPMTPTGRPSEFQAIVPPDHLPAKWDFMYFFEAMDSCGNGRIYPDLDREAPYIILRLERAGS